MKTRTILMFTASVTSISSISTADSDNMLGIEQSASSVAVMAATDAVVPEMATTAAASANVVEPVAVSAAVPLAEAAVVEAAAPAVLVTEPVALAIAEVSPPTVVGVSADALMPQPVIDIVETVPVALQVAAPAPDVLVATAVAVGQPVVIVASAAEPLQAVATPVVQTDAPAVAAVEATVAKIEEAPVTQAVAVSKPLADNVQPAAASVPEAPQYAFFDDAPSAVAGAAVQGAAADYSGAVSLDQAIAAALETSPEINQAIMNKEAIEFEREQAQGLYMPRVNIEASAGIRRLENPTRRTLGIEDDELYPLEAGITAEQTVIDFGRRHGELMRQAARTDGAALRVAERSENTALLVSRQYLDILLQQRIVAAADDNVTFHRNLVGDLGQGVQQGSISIADQQQAQERLQAAIVRKAEAEEALVNAQIQLQTLTGLSITGASMPQSLRATVSPTLGEAVAEARQNNPKVKEAAADVDAAHAMVEKANGDLYPTVGVEARGRVGEDIDGFDGETNDVLARVVLRWNIFDGGINRAKYQEMVRRASEARFRLHELTRYAEEDVRRAWNSMSTQRKVAQELDTQSKVSDDLLLSYREQFNVGRRSLLDVLDAQNTRYNVQVRLETARFAEQFAEYQVLAASNKLLSSMSLKPASGSEAYARDRFDYGPPPPAELQRRRYPR